MRNIFLFVILLFLLFNCRTLTLNQKADTLDKGEKEFAGTGDLGIGWALTAYSMQDRVIPYLPDIILSLGFQYRYGIKENLEYQFRTDHFIYYQPTNYAPTTDIFFENAFKIRVHKSADTDFSLLPYFGIGSGWNPCKNVNSFSYYPPLYLTVGIKFIGDYKNFYYGFPIGLTYDFLNSNILYGNKNFYLPDIVYGFAVGGEYIYHEKLVIRNEFAVTLDHQVLVFPGTGAALMTIITGSYSITAGKKIPGKH
jgi:hypothetical protein